MLTHLRQIYAVILNDARLNSVSFITHYTKRTLDFLLACPETDCLLDASLTLSFTKATSPE